MNGDSGEESTIRPTRWGAEMRVSDLGPDDLSVAFQPIVDLASGDSFAVEALCRCLWPEFRNPAQLFERSVEEGCTGALGRAAREVAFSLCPNIALFVNVHPKELSEGWIVRPDDPLFFHDAPLFLEVTESAALGYYDLCASVLKEVCSRSGAQLVVDDFGAGFSHLSRIVDLEPSVVKLDRTLTQHLDRQPKKRLLVTKVVELCHELDAAVVAEGLETRGELGAAIDSGVDYGQGYYLARPGYPVPPVLWHGKSLGPCAPFEEAG